jgi:hypothetical protein
MPDSAAESQKHHLSKIRPHGLVDTSVSTTETACNPDVPQAQKDLSEDLLSGRLPVKSGGLSDQTRPEASANAAGLFFCAVVPVVRVDGLRAGVGPAKQSRPAIEQPSAEATVWLPARVGGRLRYAQGPPAPHGSPGLSS